MALTTIPASLSATALTLTTAAQPNVTSLGTLTTLTVDDITINGSTISDASDLTLDVGGDIILDADGDNWLFKKSGTTLLNIQKDSNNVEFISSISDGDMKFRGNDGGSTITAMTIDMSAGGNVGIGITPSSALSIYRASGVNAYIEVAGNNNTPGSTSMLFGQDSGNYGYCWNRANQAVLFGTNGTERMRIASDGKVGIGTGALTLPQDFTVLGNYENAGFYRDYSGSGLAANYINIGRKDTNGALVSGARISGGGDNGVEASHNGYFEIQTRKAGVFVSLLSSYSGASDLVVNESGNDIDFRVESNAKTHALFVEGSSGNVGINTSSPKAILSAQNTGALTLASNDGDHTGFGLFLGKDSISTNTVNTAIGFGNTSSGRKYAAIGMQTYSDADQNGLNFYVQSTASGSSAALSEAMRITSAGLVGIGTQNPDSAVHVSGSSFQRITIESTGSYADLRLRSGSSTTQWILFNDSGSGNNSGAIKYLHSDNTMRFRTSDVDDQLVIYSSGSLQVKQQVVGGFGAVGTGGTTDWNHATNARSGMGYTLLLGSHSNGPGGGVYYHAVSYEYISKTGSGNMTQLAIPYNGSQQYIRYRYSGSWSSWSAV